VKKHEAPQEEDKGYSWQDTYGDMVTLLLCFFVLLFSFSSVNAEKWEKLVAAFSGSSGNTEVAAFDEATIRDDAITSIDAMVDEDNRDDTDDTKESEEGNVEQENVNGTFDELYEKITEYIEINDMGGQLSISRTEDVIIIRFSEMALFNSGEAEILPGNENILKHIIEIVSENISAIRMINIEGHTDNVPINSAEFTDNWDLSTKRATNMLREVVDSGLIDVKKLSATGYGEYHPVASNDTEEGRAQNRRVDFVLSKLAL
jgi:chemotaxis protein MotB